MKVIDKGLHNPHYFEWMRRSGAPRQAAGAPRQVAAANLPGVQCYNDRYEVSRGIESTRIRLVNGYPKMARRNRFAVKRSRRVQVDGNIVHVPVTEAEENVAIEAAAKKKAENVAENAKPLSECSNPIDLIDIVMAKHQEIMHVHDVFGNKTVRDIDYTKLTLSYLEKKISETEWIRLVRILDKKREKRALIQTVLDMYDNSMRDVLANLLNSLNTMHLPNDSCITTITESLFFMWKIDSLAISRLREIQNAFGSSFRALRECITAWPTAHKELKTPMITLIEQFKVKELTMAVEEIDLNRTATQSAPIAKPKKRMKVKSKTDKPKAKPDTVD